MPFQRRDTARLAVFKTWDFHRRLPLYPLPWSSGISNLRGGAGQNLTFQRTYRQNIRDKGLTGRKLGCVTARPRELFMSERDRQLIGLARVGMTCPRGEGLGMPVFAQAGRSDPAGSTARNRWPQRPVDHQHSQKINPTGLVKLTGGSRGTGHRPMGIPKLPMSVSVFCNRRKEPGLLHPIPRVIYTDFVPRGGHYRELRREWIDSQILAPMELHVLYGAREILNSFRCRCAVREHQVTFRSHEERGAVGEMPTPSRRALLGDVAGDSTGVRSHIPLDRGGACRRQGVRHARPILVRATCRTDNDE